MRLGRRGDGLLFGLVLALLVSLPFEPVHSVGSFAFLELNHIKLLLAASAVVWVALVARRGVGAWYWQDRLALAQTLGIALLIGIALVSALLAPSHRGEALKFVGRLASGLYVVLLARHLVATQPHRLTALIWAVCLGAGASALLGFGEVAGWPALDPLLATFKLAPTYVGGDLRLGGSFQYATIAAMYFELATPLALVLAVTSTTRWRRLFALTLAAVCSAAVALTLTRAGVAALAAALIILLALAWTTPSIRALRLPTAIAGLAMTIVLLSLALRLPDFNTRFGTENDWGWYAASYSAPASLSIEQGVTAPTVVSAKNTGQAAWTSGGTHPFALAYRWLSADATSQLSIPPTILELRNDIQPGESAQLTIDVEANRLPPGDYVLAWGMLEQRVLWFHDRGIPDAETSVHVDPSARPVDVQLIGQEPRSDTQTGLAPVQRAELWRAALRMFAERPLIGVGPDNFRHLYGAYLGMPVWDERVHANNLYLELLADLGALGAAAFALVVATAPIAIVRTLRHVPNIWLAGLGASLTMFLLHGTLDYFLDFTPVYVLFWLIVGLSIGVARDVEKQC